MENVKLRFLNCCWFEGAVKIHLLLTGGESGNIFMQVIITTDFKATLYWFIYDYLY